MDEPAYRARQVLKWVWGKEICDFDLMTNVSKALRAKLAETYSFNLPEVRKAEQSSDGTIKFLMSMADQKTAESVLIPAEDHYTQCVSTQIGCPMGCLFCSTGRMGFDRNLSSGEIAGQILSARKYLRENNYPLPLNNLVLMGMGEPLLNWEQVKKALSIFRDPDGLNFSRRKITLSTVGVKKSLRELGESNLVFLAVSLHAPNQGLRRSIMPGAASYEFNELISDLEKYPLAHRDRVTIEYVMLKGINDSLSHARELVKVLSKVKCKINLLRYNPDHSSDFKCSSEENIFVFQDFLRSRGFTVMLRKSMGADIHAACGQLKSAESNCQ